MIGECLWIIRMRLLAQAIISFSYYIIHVFNDFELS